MLKKQLFLGIIILCCSLLSEAQTLFKAAMAGDVKEMEKLVAQGQDVNGTAGGMTPLHMACVFKKLEAAEYLLSKGALVDATDNDGETPLAKTITQNKMDIINLLLSKGANPNLKNKKGETPLIAAVSYGKSYEMIEALYNAGGDITIKDGSGHTASQLTMFHKDKKKLDKLFSAPPKKEAK
jgi:ankyrin repeat protein